MGLFDFLADKTNDASIGDTQELIKEAEKKAIEDMGTQTNDEWGNSPSHDGVAGHTVADKGDYGATISYSR